MAIDGNLGQINVGVHDGHVVIEVCDHEGERIFLYRLSPENADAVANIMKVTAAEIEVANLGSNEMN